MKKVFTIFAIASKDIHVPSTDYYARNNEPQTESIETLQYVRHADTEAECEKYLLEEIEPHKDYSYIILPTYVKK